MKKKNILTIVIVFFLIFFFWVLYQNKALEITQYEIDCSENPRLNGFTIVHISDLHNEEFGENQQKLLNRVAECNPDIIAITGDFIDCRNPQIEISMDFIKAAVNLAAVYYVPGNHERWVQEEYRELCRQMERLGVHLMANEEELISYGNEQIVCLGIEDPDFYPAGSVDVGRKIAKDKIEQFSYSEEEFTLLLSHRPELFEVYIDAKMDLVLTGHAHGGQFRLPMIGGLAAPNQGLFPRYDAGVFEENGTHMIVSRGIGNSIIPLRLNNPPEIVAVKLVAK